MCNGCSEAELLLLNHIIYRKELFQIVNEEYTYLGYSVKHLVNGKCLLCTPQQAMDSDQWKEIYRLVEENPRLQSITVEALYYDRDTGEQMAKLYSREYREYIVVFAGTGFNEWRENLVTGSQADTMGQQRARQWYQSLAFDQEGTVTVTGHSHGGNQAIYITITEDTVTRCVAFDGEGVSRQFLDQYRNQINKNAYKISMRVNYRDYINALLYRIEGADILYIENKIGVEEIPEYHCPNALFAYDDNGKIVARLGRASRNNDPVMEFLHIYLVYLLDHVPEGEKTILLNCIGDILTALFCGDTKKRRDDIISQYSETAGVVALKYLQDLIKEYRKKTREWTNLKDSLTRMMIEYYKTGKETLQYQLLMTLYNALGEENGLDCLLYLGVSKVDNAAVSPRQAIVWDFSKERSDGILKEETEKESSWNIFRWDCCYCTKDLFDHLNRNISSEGEAEYILGHVY